MREKLVNNLFKSNAVKPLTSPNISTVTTFTVSQTVRGERGNTQLSGLLEQRRRGDSKQSRAMEQRALQKKDHPHFYHNQQDPSGSFRHKDRPVGTDHSPPSLPHSRGKERIPLPCKPSGGSELGKRSKVDKVYKGGKGARENQEMVAQREGGGPCEGKADQLDGQTKWEGARELEEGERPSSRSNSASSSKSQESGRDDRRKETKKRHKKHKKETRQPSLELLEEGELKKHKHKKKSKKSRDGGEEESSGEVDGAGKKDEDHAKLCSLMLY